MVAAFQVSLENLHTVTKLIFSPAMSESIFIAPDGLYYTAHILFFQHTNSVRHKGYCAEYHRILCYKNRTHSCIIQETDCSKIIKLLF